MPRTTAKKQTWSGDGLVIAAIEEDPQSREWRLNREAREAAINAEMTPDETELIFHLGEARYLLTRAGYAAERTVPLKNDKSRPLTWAQRDAYKRQMWDNLSPMRDGIEQQIERVRQEVWNRVCSRKKQPITPVR